MPLPNRLTQSLDFQAQALTLRSERQRLLASNIANADTPGYVARDLDFSAALRDATASFNVEGSSGAASAVGVPIRPANTHPGHIASGLPVGGGSLSTLAYARNSQNSMDRNSVDLDRERATFADNTLRYEAALRFINGGLRTMLDAIKPYNQ
jgi:flagellar basal-body rod protein FlgB